MKLDVRIQVLKQYSKYSTLVLTRSRSSTMGGGGKQAAEPKEEINLDTTNFGLWNISDNGYSTFGVGEVLTVIVLVLILAMIAK